MELAIVIGALLVVFFVVTWLLKIVRAAVRTAILVGLVLLVMFILGIGPQTVWEQIRSWLPGFESVTPR